MPADVIFPDWLESAVTNVQCDLHHASVNLFEYLFGEV